MSMHTALRVEDGKYIAGIGGSNKASNVYMSDGVTSVEDAITANKNGTIYSFTATNQSYTCPSDGYAYIKNATNYVGELIVQDSTGSQIGILKPLTNLQNQSASTMLFVRKGMKLVTGASSFSEASFIPIN